MSKNTLRIISLVFLMAVAGLYLYADNRQQYYQSRALPAAKQMFSDIAGWEKQTLIRHLSDEARQTINDQQLEQLLVQYREFGKLQSLDKLEFSRLTSAFSLFGAKRVNYTGTAHFDTGSAQLNITLIENEPESDSSRYKIYNLSIRR
jgi:hypothetical protein